MSDYEYLHTLGLRIERLILLGIILIAVGFVQIYTTTAYYQFSQDRTYAAILNLLEKFTVDEKHLYTLFRSTPNQQKAGSAEQQQSKDFLRKKKIAETREKLGLPPAPQEEISSINAPKVITYSSVLNNYVNQSAEEANVVSDELAQYNDATKAPAELMHALHERVQEIGVKSTSVFGIDTPPSLSLTYGGLDYKIPFKFISVMLAITLGPLTSFWLVSLYMTRQRELIAISNLEDYKLAFPHIFNILPVRFARLTNPKKNHQKKKDWFIHNSTVNCFFCSLERVILILLLVSPMLYTYISSFIQLLIVAGDINLELFLGAIMILIIFLQTMALVVQEVSFLKGKEFLE